MVKKECDECGRQLKIEYIDERGETSEVKLTREDVPYAVCPAGHGGGHALSLWKSGGLIEDWFREHCAENEGFLFWESLHCRNCGRKLDGDGYELPAAVEGPISRWDSFTWIVFVGLSVTFGLALGHGFKKGDEVTAAPES